MSANSARPDSFRMKFAIPPWKPPVPASATRSAIRIGARAGPALTTSSFLPPTFTSNSAAWRSVTGFPFLSMAVTCTVRLLSAAPTCKPAPARSALTTTKPAADEFNQLGMRI